MLLSFHLPLGRTRVFSWIRILFSCECRVERRLRDGVWDGRPQILYLPFLENLGILAVLFATAATRIVCWKEPINSPVDVFIFSNPSEIRHFLDYVREEAAMLLRCFVKKWEASRSDGARPKLAIVGSPGVGKSKLIVLLAIFWVTCHTQKNTQILGTLRPDGFTAEDVKRIHGPLGCYSLLATSSQQYEPKNDDPTRKILLPAWQFSDLEDFGTRTGMCKEDIKKRYYICGGSLRSVTDALKTAESALERVASSSDLMLLLLCYGAGAASGQIDTIRRPYLENRNEESQYMRCRCWRLLVDSGFLLRRLLSRCSLEEYEIIYNVTRVMGGTLFGWAFEYLLQKKLSSGGVLHQSAVILW